VNLREALAKLCEEQAIAEHTHYESTVNKFLCDLWSVSSDEIQEALTTKTGNLWDRIRAISNFLRVEICTETKECTIKFHPCAFPGPYTIDDQGSYIGCPSTFNIAQIRGFGYLAGTGGLHLPPDVAIEIQKATGHMLAQAPALEKALKNLIRVLHEPDIKEVHKALEEAHDVLDACK